MVKSTTDNCFFFSVIFIPISKKELHIMKLTKSALREIIREELTLSKTIRESMDPEKFKKALADADKLQSNMGQLVGYDISQGEIFDAVLTGLVLKMGSSGAKKYVKELTDTYKSLQN